MAIVNEIIDSDGHEGSIFTIVLYETLKRINKIITVSEKCPDKHTYIHRLPVRTLYSHGAAQSSWHRASEGVSSTSRAACVFITIIATSNNNIRISLLLYNTFSRAQSKYYRACGQIEFTFNVMNRSRMVINRYETYHIEY